MMDTVIKNDNKKDLLLENILNDIYLLPKWEMIKSFSLTEKHLFFHKKILNVNLFRKFSSKHLLEKYCIKAENDNILARMDLKVYKDSVYIINLEINSALNFERLMEFLLQAAIEKALYNTTKKEVVYNFTSNLITGGRIRKLLINNEFIPADNQSSYEKNMFGEIFSIKADSDSLWMKKIRQMPILINK